MRNLCICLRGGNFCSVDGGNRIYCEHVPHERRCMLCKVYICAYENVCMVIAGKMSDLRHFFPILLCLY